MAIETTKLADRLTATSPSYRCETTPKRRVIRITLIHFYRATLCCRRVPVCLSVCHKP